MDQTIVMHPTTFFSDIDDDIPSSVHLKSPKRFNGSCEEEQDTTLTEVCNLTVDMDVIGSHIEQPMHSVTQVISDHFPGQFNHSAHSVENGAALEAVQNHTSVSERDYEPMEICDITVDISSAANQSTQDATPDHSPGQLDQSAHSVDNGVSLEAKQNRLSVSDKEFEPTGICNLTVDINSDKSQADQSTQSVTQTSPQQLKEPADSVDNHIASEAEQSHSNASDQELEPTEVGNLTMDNYSDHSPIAQSTQKVTQATAVDALKTEQIDNSQQCETSEHLTVDSNLENSPAEQSSEEFKVPSAPVTNFATLKATQDHINVPDEEFEHSSCKS